MNKIKRIPMGYSALIDLFNLSVIPHYRQSYVVSQGRGQVQIAQHQETHIYPKQYAIKNLKNPFHHLEFALKYDGVNLEILHAVFEKLDNKAFQSYLEQHPTSKYVRILWFLYEFLTENELAMPESKRLKYVDILDPSQYFTSEGIRSTRHRVNNNLLGSKDFCPIIRKTKLLVNHINEHYEMKAKLLTQNYDSKLIARASHYLYTKETISSYEIERERPSKERINRFINLLQKASRIEMLTKELLIELQNAIVDPRFHDVDYRKNQNYVGENINQYLQKIYYISPKPENVETLMEGLLGILEDERNLQMHPVLLAAVVAFGFVFIHPFEDGNGRLHRFLIHYILSKRQFTPDGIIFPISAVMLHKIYEYDSALELFSKPLINLITQYQLSNDGILSVQQPTLRYYQYIDYTHIAEYLFKCIEETLHNHFEKEIEYLIKYDKTKSEMQAEIDMPDRLIDLFIKFVLQNNGALGSQKREKYFKMLSDDEIKKLEAIICMHMLSLKESID